MKKIALSFLLLLLFCLPLTGCSSAKVKYLQVSANGKNIDLSGDLKNIAIELHKSGFYPLSNNGLTRYDENGEEVSREQFGMNGIENPVGLSSLAMNNNTDIDGIIHTNLFIFSNKYLPDTSVADFIKFSSTTEELAKEGFVDWGNNNMFLLWADGQPVDLSGYKNQAIELLSDYDGDFKRFASDKLGINEDDEYSRYMSGSYPAIEINMNYVTSYYSLKTYASIEGNAIVKYTEENIPEAQLNAFEACLASMELGQKFRDGNIKNYGAVIISEKEIIISNAFIEK